MPRIKLKDGTYLDQQTECPQCGASVRFMYVCLTSKLRAYEVDEHGRIKSDDGGSIEHYPICPNLVRDRIKELAAYYLT